MRPGECPSVELLQAFQLGDLPEPLLDGVAEHLETCVRCETLAQGLDSVADTILSAVRSPSSAGFRPKLPVPPAPARPYPFLSPPVTPGEVGRLANYRVLGLLGKGGMAYVFAAEELTLRRTVALKVMKPDLITDPDGWQRFLREARIMAAVKHDHLVTVYEVGQEGMVVYLAMQLLEGETLGAFLRRGARPAAAELLRLAREITSGLAVVHAQGLIHRDLKPDNIWLESAVGPRASAIGQTAIHAPEAPTEIRSPIVAGRVKILDFGLARFLRDDVRLTHTGTIMGTPAFMSPEQARGLAVDARSDLFSLGAVLYCLCTGRAPFEAGDTMAVLTSLAVDTPRPVNDLNPEVPGALAALIAQLLAKKPDLRPASAELVVERLRSIGTEPGGLQPPTPQLPRMRRATGLRLDRAALGVLFLTALMGIALGLVIWQLGRRVPTTTAVAESPGSTPPTSESASTVVYLSDLKPLASENWPLPRNPRGELIPNFYRRISVKDKDSPHGVGMHPAFDGPASASYSLGKKFSRFATGVSLNDTAGGCHVPLTFKIYGDGVLLWESKPLESQEGTQEPEVSVHGVDVLKLEVTSPPKNRGCHGVWIEPRLIR